MSSAAFGFASRLHLAVDYGYRHQFRQAPFILIESAHAGHTGAGFSPQGTLVPRCVNAQATERMPLGCCTILIMTVRGCLTVLIVCGLAFADDKEDVLRRMEAKAPYYGEISRKIWEFAEVGYKETSSSALLREELRRAGFRVEDGVAGMPTAFVATWGSGRPVIGIMGEYDALPGLSQDAVPQRKPLANGAPGHGDRKSTRLNSSHIQKSRMPSSA